MKNIQKEDGGPLKIAQYHLFRQMSPFKVGNADDDVGMCVLEGYM